MACLDLTGHPIETCWKITRVNIVSMSGVSLKGAIPPYLRLHLLRQCGSGFFN